MHQIHPRTTEYGYKSYCLQNGGTGPSIQGKQAAVLMDVIRH